MLLSIQLHVSIVLQVYLTSSKKVMNKYANSLENKILLITIGTVVAGINLMMLINTINSFG